MPKEIDDRQADMWEPLLAIADAAGSEWGEKVRAAAIKLVAISRSRGRSLGVLLLAHLKEIFGTAEQMFTADILERLHNMEEAPWSDMKGKPLTPRGLASFLRKYEVQPEQMRGGYPLDADGVRLERSGKGYTRASLSEAWKRYVPDPESETGANP